MQSKKELIFQELVFVSPYQVKNYDTLSYLLRAKKIQDSRQRQL
jgi:hypothetical protein